MQNLPPLPEPEPEQEFEIKLEPTEPEPQFVPEEEFETKLETKEPKPEFTIPNTPDSTTQTFYTSIVCYFTSYRRIYTPSSYIEGSGQIN